MPLNYKSYEEILQNALDILTGFTNITQLTPGAKARSLLEAVSQEIGVLAQSFDLELAEAFIRTATGDSQDFIGELLGTPRLEAQKAEVTAASTNIKFNVISGTFGDINDTQDIIVPSGTTISADTRIGVNDESIQLVTTEDVTLPAASTEVYVSAISVGTGSRYTIGANKINSHTFTNYTDLANGTLRITNVDGISGGTDRETDNNYRYRLSQSVLASEAANETAIRLATLSVAGVANVVMVPYDRGTGSFSVYIKSIYPVVSSTLIDQVQSAIVGTQAYGNKGIARSPKNIGIEMTITINYREALTQEDKDNIVLAVDEALVFYINNLEIGEDFIFQEVVQRVLEVDSRIKNIGQPQKPFDEIYFYRDSRLSDNRIRNTLISDYTANSDERVLVEYTISSPINIRNA